MGASIHILLERRKTNRSRLSYNNDDINYFGTEALDYLESDDPIYDHCYMKTARKNISVWTVYIFLSRFASPMSLGRLANTLG